MDILIKGMEMPKSCDICPFVCENDNVLREDYRHLYCGFPGIGEFVADYIFTRHKDCPLVEVKAPHGELIDRTELIKKAVVIYDHNNYERLVVSDGALADAPTIIEAEGKDDG